MPINMSDYKVIYDNQVYKCLQIIPMMETGSYMNEVWEMCDIRVAKLTIFYIDDSNRVAVVEGKPEEFQFIRK